MLSIAEEHDITNGWFKLDVKAAAGLGSLTLSDRVWADPQRCLSVQ
jgi:hypothetical protein